MFWIWCSEYSKWVLSDCGNLILLSPSFLYLFHWKYFIFYNIFWIGGLSSCKANKCVITWGKHIHLIMGWSINNILKKGGNGRGFQELIILIYSELWNVIWFFCAQLMYTKEHPPLFPEQPESFLSFLVCIYLIITVAK